MSGRLTRHLQRTYGTMIAFFLIGVTLCLGFVAYGVQVRRLDTVARDALNTLAARAQHVGRITTTRQVEQVVSKTSYPGWMLRIASDSMRFVVRWPSRSVTVEPRTALTPAPYPWNLLTGFSILTGVHDPPKAIVDSNEFTLFPVSSLETIALRTFGAMLIVALLALLFAMRIGERMAVETLRPLRSLHEALKHMAETGLGPHSVAVPGNDEIGEVIATYNEAIQSALEARAAMERAEVRTHQFIADAGHQLRTPLTVLSGFVGIMRKGQLRHPEDGPKILEKMDLQIAIMRKLVERLMLLESWQSADDTICELTDVGEFITTVVDPMAAAHTDRIVRINTISGACACVDSSELTYAVTNIVANSLKYAPESSITVDVHADEKNVYIAIADEGPGIPPESLPHIFDRFYRGSRRDVPGSGLGLAIAQIAVERAHGTLTAESEPGKGARFIIALPRVVQLSPRKAPAAAC